MAEIDKRGWRCDILDMHCYWPEWNLNNALKDYYNKYKRPIWVSEFVWGSFMEQQRHLRHRPFFLEGKPTEKLRRNEQGAHNWNSFDYVGTICLLEQ